MDVIELAKLVPLSKKATPLQIIGLLIAMGLLIACGWYASGIVKGYFDKSHSELVLLITEQNSKVAAADTKAEKAIEGVGALRHYGWSNSDMVRWANQLDRANRTSVPALIVPEVPAPASVPTSN